MRVGFIGLGNMGRPIAQNLAGAGNDLTVFNRTRSRAEEIKGEHVRVADSPADAAREADVVITMLADDHAVENVVFGEGGDDSKRNSVLQALRPGAVHISMSTISVALSKRLKETHAAANQHFIAAPVFGRPEAAIAAKLSVVAAGPAEQIEKCRPLLEAVGQKLFVVGEVQPNANLMKLAGNFMIASMLESIGEAFALVRKSGVEASQFLEVINDSIFNSPLYKNYGTLIAEERFEPAGFKLKLGLKDSHLALAAADGLEVPMPLASLTHDNFLSALAQGLGESDWATIARLSADRAGLKSH
jgi:3-hydroxyisobutyrate dehydrogenase-like beta-hydroxyacid dehydrogenase